MTYCSCGHRLADHTQHNNADATWHAPCMRCGCVQFDDDPQAFSPSQRDEIDRAIHTVEQMRETCRTADDQNDTVHGMRVAFTLTLLTLRSIRNGTSPTDEFQGVLL